MLRNIERTCALKKLQVMQRNWQKTIDKLTKYHKRYHFWWCIAAQKLKLFGYLDF